MKNANCKRENPLVCTERVHVVQNGVGVFLPEEPNNVCFPICDFKYWIIEEEKNQQRPPSPNAGRNSFIQSTVVDPRINDSLLINSNFSTSKPKPTSGYSAPIIHAIRTPPTFSNLDSGKAPATSIVEFPAIDNNRSVISITPSNQWGTNKDDEGDYSTFPAIRPFKHRHKLKK
uniref:Uncharacterized protein n=1 Tax=Romanomermis culicivorax TaxID=13658 RepID=A0A915ILZ0_ROMCU